MIEVLYMTVGLDDGLAEQCEGWVQRFGQIAGQPSLEIPCDVRKVEGDLRGRLEATFAEEDMGAITASAMDVFLDCEKWTIRDGEGVRLPKLVVVCQPSNPLVQKIQATNPGALWGASNGMIAFIYHHEPTVIWHEMLHLLGADDCYEGQSAEESDVPTCRHRNCIMQYAPSLELVGDPPFICKRNVEFIRSKWAEISAEAG